MARSQPLNPILRSAFLEPAIKREEEEALCVRWQRDRDQRARRELARRTTRFVIRAARQLEGYNVPLDDLVSEGTIGLLRAVDGYDTSFNVRFMTYADYWVRAAMMARIMKSWSMVSVSQGAFKSKYFFRLRRELAKARALLGETPAALAEAANVLGVPEHRLVAIERELECSDLSLSAPAPQASRRAVEDSLCDEHDFTRELEHSDVMRRLLPSVDEILGQLSPRQATIVRRRYLEEEPVTLNQLAQEFGVSRERVRQLEVAALTKLRQAILRSSPDAQEELARAA